MPNPIPPAGRPATAATPTRAPRTSATRSTLARPGAPKAPSTRTSGLPAAWGQQDIQTLLRPPATVRRSPINPVAIAQGTAATVRSDLAALHTTPEARFTVTTKVECRVVDAKLRVAIEPPQARVRVAAERRGGLLTVFLPGSVESPAPGFTVAALPLDTRGRLTLGAAVCTELGVTEHDTVAVRHDPQRCVVEIYSPVLLDAALSAATASVRRPEPTRVRTVDGAPQRGDQIDPQPGAHLRAV